MKEQAYYEDLKRLARQVRAEHGLHSPRVLESDLRRIYEKNGIVIDDWPYRLRNLRGAFICDRLGTTVMLASGLPPKPSIRASSRPKPPRAGTSAAAASNRWRCRSFPSRPGAEP